MPRRRALGGRVAGSDRRGSIGGIAEDLVAAFLGAFEGSEIEGDISVDPGGEASISESIVRGDIECDPCRSMYVILGSVVEGVPMTLDENMADMEMHAREFDKRSSFTYSVLGGDDVVGCVYIYPSKDPNFDAHVRSWVRASRPELDAVVWRVERLACGRGSTTQRGSSGRASCSRRVGEVGESEGSTASAPP